MRKNYTIIIPHYNIPQLLRRCLASIPKREDLQVIVVDDKSNEENIQKLKRLEHEYCHVEFIYSKINGGGGKARNIGLKYAEGKYVLFADADDFFNYCINDILDEYTKQDWDAVYFNANHIDTETYLNTNRSTTLQQALHMYYKDGSLDPFRYIFGEPWCKMVKRDIIERNYIRFDEIPIHNDTKYSYLTGYFANNVWFDNRALYCLADRLGSVSKELSDEKLAIRTKVFAEKNLFLKEKCIPYFDNLMLSPFSIYLKRRDFNKFRICLGIVKIYGYDKGFIIKKLIKRIIMSKLRCFKI
jgi:glycosyltransferase involved in cell wall biosynthesis